MFSQDLFKEMIEKGYVKASDHPTVDLTIYNYSQLAQYESCWNEVTMKCRGLILNSKGEVVARPFEKFFNLGERSDQVIPNEAFEVFEKMDGSLGILFFYNGKFEIATRGSFNAEQGIRANQILMNQYLHVLPNLNQDYTYLLEIIYPENRIVVDYGEKEELVLLAIIDRNSGKELPLSELGFPLVKKYNGIQDLNRIREIQEENREGFVVKFENGFRVKVKFEEYVRLHRIVTQVSSYTIWEFMREQKPLEELLDRVPDEFYKWVKRVCSDLQSQFLKIENEAIAEFKPFASRKDAAEYFTTCSHSAILFRMLDKRPYEDIIWKMIKPSYERPFADKQEV